jgi:hypothetical protein
MLASIVEKTHQYVLSVQLALIVLLTRLLAHYVKTEHSAMQELHHARCAQQVHIVLLVKDHA